MRPEELGLRAPGIQEDLVPTRDNNRVPLALGNELGSSVVPDILDAVVIARRAGCDYSDLMPFTR
jgi:hypothetical protein